MLASALFGAIPSPSFNTIPFWPRPLSLYGLSIGLGVIAATYLVRSRLAARRIHPDTAMELLVWALPSGLVGARLYHVLTDQKPLADWLKIWEGGLGVPGAIIGGALGVIAFIRLRDLPLPQMADAIAPALPLAQAFGRWGNWWNQELYGEPTDLPWALEIDEDHRLRGFEAFETYHPTFLYESLWNLGLCGVLLWLDRRGVLKTGKLIWVYAGGYAIGRLWIEALRIDPATELGGLRWNIWMMSAVLLVSVVMLRNGFGRDADDAIDAADGDTDGDTDGDSGNNADEAAGDDGPHRDSAEAEDAAGDAATT